MPVRHTGRTQAIVVLAGHHRREHRSAQTEASSDA
jgi:hypothetical protein